MTGVRYRVEEVRMGSHVDLVKNEWLAGFQYVVARVRVEAGRVEIESPEPEMWEAVVLRPLQVRERAELVYAEKEPEDFLRWLPEAIHGTYLFATAVHSDESCPFQHHPMLPITSVEDSHRSLTA